MADLSTIKPVERMVEILHPNTDKPVGLRVTLMSMLDPRMKKLKRQLQDERNKRAQRGKIFKAEETEENQNKLVFAAMTGWFWYNPTGKKGDEGFDDEADLNFHGKKPEFNQKNVYDVFNELEWVVNQLVDAIDDEKAFFG